MRNYETPEIVDLGDARKLTLGMLNPELADACDCGRRPGGEIIAL